MKKILFPLVFLTSLASSSLVPSCLQAKTDPFLFGNQDSLHIIVNNRVLAKINGKAISVVDIMKKMDVLFYRQFPEYTSSTQARYQFYQVNWKYSFRDLIDKELIMIDAEENKLPVTNGDIRQEMESLFGPNIVTNLDKIGMTYDEAWNIVKGDIILRRMLQYKVHSKAFREVNPQAMRLAYNEFAKENIIPETFVYEVISVRNKDADTGKKVADEIQQKLANNTLTTKELREQLKSTSSYEGTSLSLSEEFTHSEKEMSAAYKEIVLKLNEESFSETIAQKSRADNSTVFRIFFLSKKNEGGVKPFGEVENSLREKLIGNAIEKETISYLKKLRNLYDVQENQLAELTDEDYQPFTMK